MRYYVFAPSEPGTKSHILAEVVRDESDQGEEREMSYASALSGAATFILLPDEVAADPDGAEALARWDVGDDRVFDSETTRIRGERKDTSPKRVGHLSLVSDPIRMRSPRSEDERAAGRKKAADLFVQADRLIARAQQILLEIDRKPR